MNPHFWFRKPDAIWGPIGIRIHGLVTITQGIAVLLFGTHAPGWTLKHVLWASLRDFDKDKNKEAS